MKLALERFWAWWCGRHLDLYRLQMRAAIRSAQRAREADEIDVAQFHRLYAAAVQADEQAIMVCQDNEETEDAPVCY